MIRSGSHNNLKEKKRRPLSQSLSINNLHRLTPSLSKSKDQSSANKSHHRDSRIITSSTPTVTTTTSNATATGTVASTNSSSTNSSSTNSNPPTTLPRSRSKHRSMLLDDKELSEKRKSKRFSMFMKFTEETDSDNDDKSTIDNSPFTQNNDTFSLNMSTISMDTDSEKSPDKLTFSANDVGKNPVKSTYNYDTSIDSKKRTSNLSNIMEFVNQINYDFDEGLVVNNRKLIQLEAHEVDKFNNPYDYNMRLVGNTFLFGYYDEQNGDGDSLGLEDIDYAGAFSEEYHLE